MFSLNQINHESCHGICLFIHFFLNFVSFFDLKHILEYSCFMSLITLMTFNATIPFFHCVKSLVSETVNQIKIRQLNNFCAKFGYYCILCLSHLYLNFNSSFYAVLQFPSVFYFSPISVFILFSSFLALILSLFFSSILSSLTGSPPLISTASIL